MWYYMVPHLTVMYLLGCSQPHLITWCNKFRFKNKYEREKGYYYHEYYWMRDTLLTGNPYVANSLDAIKD